MSYTIKDALLRLDEQRRGLAGDSPIIDASVVVAEDDDTVSIMVDLADDATIAAGFTMSRIGAISVERFVQALVERLDELHAEESA